MDADLRAAVLKVAGEYDLAGKISSYNKYLGPRASFPKIQSKVEQDRASSERLPVGREDYTGRGQGAQASIEGEKPQDGRVQNEKADEQALALARKWRTTY